MVQALLEGISTVLVYRLTVRVAATLGAAAGRRSGRAAALLYALNPVQVRYVNELLTETLLSLLLLLGLCLLTRYVEYHSYSPLPDRPRRRAHPARLALAVGAVAGLAALCKPNVLYLPILWLPAMLLAPHLTANPAPSIPLCQHRGRDAALALAAIVALLSPWVARNQAVFGRPFLSTAFQGNVSRISAPAALLTARGRYAIPWSAEWESAFGEIVARAAQEHHWDRAWEKMDVRARFTADRQVYQVARQVLAQHPVAWSASHLQGLLRYLEPQTYRALHADWTGTAWPPDVLDDALIHTARALARGDWHQAGRILAEERWSRLNPLQRVLWWSQSAAILLTLVFVVRGVWALRRHPALLWAVVGTIAYVLVLPGPIAYERFRAPVLGPILALALLPFASPRRLCYNRRR
jgi:4-amino-4-deoxy-L-arabinose transferase-like glycosyltransferase